MKKKVLFLTLLTSAFVFASCGGSKSINDKDLSHETYESGYSIESEEETEDESETFDDGTFSYKVSDDRCILLGFKEGFDYSKIKNLTLPKKVNGYNVVEIDNDAFSENHYIETLTIPGTYDYLGWYCFDNCSNLKEVTFEDGVTSIGENSFSHCTNLKTVNLPNTLEIIYYCAFFECYSLNEIVIPDSVDTIEYQAFGYTGLYKVTLGKKLDYIDPSAFDYSYKLLEIYNLSNLDINSDNYCINKEAVIHDSLDDESVIQDINGSKFITISGVNYLIYAPIDDNTLVLPDNVNYSIYNYAFYSMNFETVIIPECVDTICEYAFTYSKVRYLSFENGIKNINEYAFANCYNLFTVTLPQSLEYVSEYTFNECTSLKEIYNLTNISDFDLYIPYLIIHTKTDEPSIYTIDSDVIYAVYEDKAYVCGYIDTDSNNEITIKNKIKYHESNYDVKYISDGAFYYSNLKKITIGSSIEEIGNYAFQSSRDLTEVTFESNSKLRTIRESAFYDCSSLASIVIPDSVEELGSMCFDSCYNLKSVTLSNKIITIPSYCFEYCYDLCDITLPDSIQIIEEEAFCRTNIKSINIPKNLFSISESAFGVCSELSEIIVDSDNEVYKSGKKNNYLLDSTTNLLLFLASDATLPDKVIIGKFSMSNYEEETITLSNNIIGIHSQAFYESNVKTVKFEGTKKEFDKIADLDWELNSYITKLICKDGQYAINEEEEE